MMGPPQVSAMSWTPRPPILEQSVRVLVHGDRFVTCTAMPQLTCSCARLHSRHRCSVTATVFLPNSSSRNITLLTWIEAILCAGEHPLKRPVQSALSLLPTLRSVCPCPLLCAISLPHCTRQAQQIPLPQPLPHTGRQLYHQPLLLPAAQGPRLSPVGAAVGLQVRPQRNAGAANSGSGGGRGGVALHQLRPTLASGGRPQRCLTQ